MTCAPVGGGGPRDRGSATIWMLGVVLLVLAVLTATLVRAAAVLARHRAESAADLAALAAAGRIGTSGAPCAAAESSAGHNRASLVSCAVRLDADGRSGTVLVQVSEAVSLPVVGGREVSASARAGRLPAAAAGSADVLGAWRNRDISAHDGADHRVWQTFARTEPV